jgi:LPXTG-motif cell wall-anchored protein
MSRTTTSRLAAAGLLTLAATSLTGLVLAPTASAAETLPAVKVSDTSVTPGQKFTVSGTGCISPDDANYEALAFVGTDDFEDGKAAEPAADGSWSVTVSLPAGTAAGEIQLYAVCDWYEDRALYPLVTLTVEGTVGAIRGVAANTPGTQSVTNDWTTTSSAPGKKVVRIIEGFRAGEVVTLVMHSTPVVLGTFTADAQGIVTAEFTLPAGTAAGTHTFVYEGNLGTYFQESFEVTAATKTLAYTGGDMTVPLTVGLGLVAAGAGVLVVSRRRKTEAAPQI